MSDAKFFQTTKKGEVHELREELNSSKLEVKRDAVKKVIAAMTVGKDVSMLFMDVLKCITTSNMELKKLVYLYIINYAKSQPDLAILAVNTFVKDSTEDPNPLIRALAVRTMGCIRVDKITEYLSDPLRKSLADDDPYVRKTAAICVAKLYDILPEMVEDQGFLDSLNNLLADSNPMVVANAVAALCEIQSTASHNVFKISSTSLHKILAALNESSEWGQVFLLDALVLFEPEDGREAESIVERVTPRLSHANAAVVLSAAKVVLKMMDHITNAEILAVLTKKLCPPLVTLLSAEPEVQYVALRNINLICQKRPNILANEIRVFFCKYNDPVYVKTEKLEILVRLATDRNIEQVLMELKEYATEVDIAFVKKAIGAIGRCAIKLDRGVERAVQTLLDLINTKVDYVVQEAIVVIKDIFRRYPSRYESIIPSLTSMEAPESPEGRSAMIWIIGEYAEYIENAAEIMKPMLERFADEDSQVQLQLLSACVKLFLKRPDEAQEMVQTILGFATQDSDNPDLRDRGYIYWRLLSTDPSAAKAVVLAEKPIIDASSDDLDAPLMKTLLNELSLLSSIFHKPSSDFVACDKERVPSLGSGRPEEEEDDDDDDRVRESPRGGDNDALPSVDDMIGLIDMMPGPSTAAGAEPIAQNNKSKGGFDNLLDDLLGLAGPPVSNSNNNFNSMARNLISSQGEVLLSTANGAGMQLTGGFQKGPNGIVLQLTVTNMGQMPLDGFAIQFNKNSFGISPGSKLQVPSPVMPGDTVNAAPLSLSFGGPAQQMTPINKIQMAIKNNVQVSYFSALIPVSQCLVEDGGLEKKDFLELWKSIPAEYETSATVYQLPMPLDAQKVISRLSSFNLFHVASRQGANNAPMMYFCGSTPNRIPVLLELTFNIQSASCTIAVKSKVQEVGSVLASECDKLLK